MSEDERDRQRVYRSKSTSMTLAAISVTSGAIMVMFLILTWGDVGELMVFGFGLVFAAWLGVRASRCGVFVEDDGLRVRNAFSTVHLKWSEITRFELSSYGACTIKRVHGGSVGMFAIQQTARDALRGKADTDEARMIAELNALLESHRGERASTVVPLG